MGIVCIRGDLRLCLQFGVSRRTSFLSELTAVLAVSALLSVVGEVITGIVQLATANVPNFTVSDLCQLDFFRDTRVLGFGGHMAGDYRVTAESLSGRCSVPSGSGTGGRTLDFRTTSGNISVSFENS